MVYSKPWIQRIDTVVEYLARYSHRIALSDSRLLDLQEGQVQLRFKDYRDHDRHKIMILSAEDLIRRLLLTFDAIMDIEEVLGQSNDDAIIAHLQNAMT